MSLERWAANGWLRRHAPTREEIAGLLSIVERDLRDAAAKGVSADWRFGIAYNAALKLCTILLHASGYRAERNLQHYRTLQSLPLILGERRKADAGYLETCRVKRHAVEYDAAGGATDADARELSAFARGLQKDVVAWLKERHRGLV
jgi:hypothetical protein